MTRCGRVRRFPLAAVLVLAGCATAPVEMTPPRPDGAPAVSATPPTTLIDFEISQWQSARELERQGRLAESAWAWEVLTVLEPDNAEYRSSLASVRKQIDTAVAERLQRAAHAQTKGELDAATTQYLTVLSLQPDNAQAADALRAIERERNKRNYLGKLSRTTLARRATDSEKPLAGSRAAPDRNDVEHASLLATQGELDEAIAMLEHRIAADRRDDAARLLLADLYVQKADKLLAGNGKVAAIASLQNGLKLDAKHPRAALMLEQLQGHPPGSRNGAESAGDAPAAALRGMR